MLNPSKNTKDKRAFISFDMMLSILPVVLMVAYTLTYVNFITENSDNLIKKQILHNKLVSVANLVVNDLAAKKMFPDSPEPVASIKPNWVDETELAKIDVEDLRKSIGLVKLYVGWKNNDNQIDDNLDYPKTCIYRIVVYAENKEIRQIFVCGE